MTRPHVAILWGLAALLVAWTAVRVARSPDPYSAGAATVIEDRREHRFRDYTWAQAEQVLHTLAREAEAAPDAVTRARALARIASLQHERGFVAQADAAAREAMRLAPTDAEARRMMTTPLTLPPANASGR